MEYDVTRIELQAVGGIVLAALGLWYDDFAVGATNPVTQDLIDVLTYTTGVESNDADFVNDFPYLAEPFSGFGECGGALVSGSSKNYPAMIGNMNLGTPKAFMSNYPNPASTETTFKIRVQEKSSISLTIMDLSGRVIEVALNQKIIEAGTHEFKINASKLTPRTYFANLESSNERVQSIKFTVMK